MRANPLRPLPPAAAAVLAGLLGGCLPPPPGAPSPEKDKGPTAEEKLRQRVKALEQEIARLKETTSGLAGVREGLETLTVDMGELRREVRGRQGDLEMVQHRLDRLADRQERLYEDVDARLRNLEQGGDAAAAAKSEEGDKAGEKVAPSAGKGTAEEAYEAAFAKIEANEYEAAAEAFQKFLGEHGDSDLAPNARYWLGESHYVMREFKPALKAFNKVLEKHPESRKAPASLLKIGYAFYELGEYDSARKALQRVRERFPDSSEARLARKRLDRIAEEGH